MITKIAVAALVGALSGSLAATRGVPELGILRAEAMATVRLLAQVLVYPMIGIELFVLLFAGRGFGALADRMLGALAFCAIAALVLGALSSACRHWAKARGRSWLFSIVLIPWFAAELLNQPQSAFFSIPGILGHLWGALTGMSS